MLTNIHARLLPTPVDHRTTRCNADARPPEAQNRGSVVCLSLCESSSFQTLRANSLLQVLVNLLTNAVQHGDRTAPIHFIVQGAPAEVDIVALNQGIAIPPDALQVIFHPLVRVAKSESALHERPSTSLGRGLFIAREIVLAHGGAISVRSTQEAGPAFSVRLPRSGSLIAAG